MPIPIHSMLKGGNLKISNYVCLWALYGHRLLLKTSKSSNRSQVLISLHTPYRHAMQADCWEEGADFVVCYFLSFQKVPVCFELYQPKTSILFFYSLSPHYSRENLQEPRMKRYSNHFNSRSKAAFVLNIVVK